MALITTQREIRRHFWRDHPAAQRRMIPNYSGTGKMHATDTRCAFVDYLDMLAKDGAISADLADRATLSESRSPKRATGWRI